MITGHEPDETIGPPAATSPAQLCRLISDALSDGDLPAALSYYEPDAVIAASGQPVATGPQHVQRSLAQLVNARLAIDIDVTRVLTSGPLALIRARWMARGLHADGSAYSSTGAVTTVARRDSAGAWRIAIEELRTDR